jgi:threonyl-tRNA synthetase
VQAVIVTVADRQLDYARSVRERLRVRGLRVELDERAQTLNAKIREAQLQKVPFTLVIGDNEVQAGAVSPRRYGGEDLKSMPLDAFEALLTREAAWP